MKRYPAWQALFRSFYSMDFYRDVASNWKEIGFLYLFLMAGLTWAVFAIGFQVSMNDACDKVFFPLADQFPTLTAGEGKFSIDKPCPYTISLAAGTPIVIFDTTGKTTPAKTGIVTLVTDKEIIFPATASTGATNKFPITADTNFTLTTAQVHGFVQMFKNYASIAVFFGGWALGSLFLFIQALFYALAGLIFSAVTEAKLSFDKLVRLAAISITPPLLLEAILKLAIPTLLQDPNVAMGYRAASLVISLVYLCLAIRACKGMNGAQPVAPAAGPNVAASASVPQAMPGEAAAGSPAAEPPQSPPGDSPA